MESKSKDSLCILPWQIKQWKNLVSAHRAGRMDGGYLLLGSKNSGKFSFVFSFAAWLLCRDRSDDSACGICKACSLVLAGSHPDLFIVKPENEGSIIKVDQVRKIQEFTYTTAQYQGMRIVIVSQAELMNINAANALLKSLEEPGVATILFLLSSNLGAIAQTIKSRCHTLLFRIPEKFRAIEWMASQVHLDGDEVEKLLALSGGNPLLALKMNERGELKSYDALVKDAQSLYKGKVTPIFLAKDWEKKDVPQILLWLAYWLGDVIRLFLGGQKDSIQNIDIFNFLQYVATKSSLFKIFQLYDWLLEQRYRLLMGGNQNKQLILEGAFCKYLDLIF